MAHKSSLEKCKLKMKKFRAAKKNKQLKENLMTEEERKEREFARKTPDSISTLVDEMIYDFDHKQLTPKFFPRLKELCDQRENEIRSNKTEDINKFQLQRIIETQQKLEVEQNARRTAGEPNMPFLQ